jgi:hypothetical protein
MHATSCLDLARAWAWAGARPSRLKHLRLVAGLPLSHQPELLGGHGSTCAHAAGRRLLLWGADVGAVGHEESKNETSYCMYCMLGD